jgi:hypothetical protein
MTSYQVGDLVTIKGKFNNNYGKYLDGKIIDIDSEAMNMDGIYTSAYIINTNEGEKRAGSYQDWEITKKISGGSKRRRRLSKKRKSNKKRSIRRKRR